MPVACAAVAVRGMLPTWWCVLSVVRCQRRGVGWVRKGSDVCYYQNTIKRKGGYYYTASFSLIFENHNDTVYIAHSYPYTYTDLQRCVSSLLGLRAGIAVRRHAPITLALHLHHAIPAIPKVWSGPCTWWPSLSQC